MIDFDKLLLTVVKGLKDFLEIPVIRSNQNVAPPKYPFCSYTITLLDKRNNGTWGVYEDHVERMPITQTWSISFLSDNSNQSMNLALKAKNWFQNIGRLYLKDNGVIVQSVTSITNRDNFISIEYEYKNGFDVVFWMFDEVCKEKETIEKVEFIDLIEKKEYLKVQQ